MTSNQMLKLQELAFYGSITALAFVGDDLLVAGRGCKLAVYNWRTGELLHEVRLFKRSKIQGFAVGSHKILVWGAYSFGFINVDDLFGGHSFREFLIRDWCMMGHWAQRDGVETPYLVTAHNILLRISPDCHRLEEIITCDIECILYSAALYSGVNDILVAAGEVLGSIEIWSAMSRKVLAILNGHEGSIFSVQFSHDGKYVVSCSDDRSIRLWNRETQECLAIGWGHTARIWQLRFLGKYILSSGEDNSARLWEYKNAKLECMQVFEGHTGRNVWSLSALGKDKSIIATGGADGRVRLWDISEMSRIRDSKYLKLFDEITTGISPSCGAIKQYALLHTSTYAFSTYGGYIVEYDFEQNSTKKLYHSPDITGFSLLRGWKDKHCIAVGDRTGSVHVLNKNGYSMVLEPPQRSAGKTTEMVTLSIDAVLYLVVQYGNLSCPWSLYAFSQSEDGFTLLYSTTLEAQTTFPISSGFISSRNKYITLGSRFGAIAVYSIAHAPTAGLLGCYRRVISDDCITSLLAVTDEPGETDLLVTSRSGAYAVCSLSTDGEFAFDKIHLNKIGKGSIEGSAYINNELLFWGFRNNYFFIWNESLQYEVTSEVCGGPHRFWTFDIFSSSSYKFVYTKSTSICALLGLQECERVFTRPILQDGSHGREIRAIAVSPRQREDGATLIASGAEDTCIRLANVYPDGKIRTLHVLHRHVSGIQELKWSEDGAYLFSSSAREEFFVWKATVRYSEHYLYPVAAAPIESELPDLRVMDFYVAEQFVDGKKRYIIATVYSDSTIKIWNFIPSTASFRLRSTGRYKTCCIFKILGTYQDDQLQIYIGSSDGYLTLYKFSNISASHLLEAEGAGLLQFPRSTWSIPVHQSSIKSLDISPIADDKILLISGGDDNSIASTLADGTSATMIQTIANAHASTITSVTFVAEARFISTAVDQRIKFWQVSRGGELECVGEEYTTVSDTGCAAITDSCEKNGSRIVLVGGAGLDMFKSKW
ncbi:WD40-repeat-containing domain protein [Limtongia smithiae]|uniref:WD40-repeat-containing domain protein n=1 Tax=Limtongia smithiae TaxID=1125753 RepID=UPI0034CDF214